MIFFMNKTNLLKVLLLISGPLLFSVEYQPRYEVIISGKDDYSRPEQLLSLDKENNMDFQFSQGLEIVTDIPKVKVLISDKEVARTPYEDSEFPAGYYRVKLLKPGFPDVEVRVLVNPGKRTTLTVHYLSKSISDDNEVTRREETLKNGAFYSVFNPEDPLYYARIHFHRDLFQNIAPDLIVNDNENYPLITLTPQWEDQGVYTYYWNGRDIDGVPASDGEFRLYAVEDYSITSSFQTDRRFTRKAVSTFSGMAGLSLVPFAQILFPGSFQFSSTISSDYWDDGSTKENNIPFSFSLRFSPVKGWEASTDIEISMRSDSSIPFIKASTSQKVLLYGELPFLVSLNGRFSYRADINDFHNIVYNRMVRDPAGASISVPLQFKVNLWDIYMSPEFLYSYSPLQGLNDTHDYTGIFRWGVSYTDKFFQAGYSTALYTVSYRGTPIIVQTGLDLNFYLPRSPLFFLLNMVYQEVRDTSESITFGLGLGFLL